MVMEEINCPNAAALSLSRGGRKQTNESPLAFLANTLRILSLPAELQGRTRKHRTPNKMSAKPTLHCTNELANKSPQTHTHTEGMGFVLHWTETAEIHPFFFLCREETL